MVEPQRSTIRRPATRRAGGLVAALALTLGVSACGGPQSSGGRSVMASERLIGCSTFAGELRRLSVNTASEAELVTMMERARAEAPRCESLWMEQAETPGARVIAAAESHQLPFHALLLESVLSARFDNMHGYCDIIDESMAMLFSGLSEIEGALEGTPLTDDERSRLVELRDLDLEALDVLLLHRAENCDD